MTRSPRVLLTLLLAAWLVMPGIGSDTDGGENAGGTGIWILPAAMAMGEAQLDPAIAARATKQFTAVGNGVVLAMSSDLAGAVAVVVSDATSETIALDVSGCSVHVPQGLVDALAASGKPVKILITDANHVGYVIDCSAERQGDSALKRVSLVVR